MKQLIRYLIWFLPLFAAYNSQAQNNTVYGAGISYTNGAPTWVPNPRTSRAAVDTVTGRWYHFNTPGGWQWIGNTVEEIAGCAAPAYTPSKGDSRLVINNCVKPEVYWYDGTVWKWINEGEVYTAGQGIRIESNTIILDSLYVLRFRTGSNTDGAAGTMSWNTTEETVDLVTDQGAVTGHLMESAYYNTRNTTGAPITIGTVVMANGTTGNTGRILIAPAIADGSVNSEYILGITAQTIGNNSNGKVQHFGKIRGIQTNGANYGETWVDGDILYCSAATPGYLTKVLPTAPNLKVPIAIVIHAHPSNGTLFVRPSHFPDLAQINDVQLTSPTNGQVLTYNSTLSRWENATPANQLQTLSTDNTPGNISISSGNTITLNVNDADASATNELQSLSVAANTATLSNSGGSVTIAGAGINTVGTAGTTITVTGTEVDGSTTNELQTLSTGTNTLTLSNGGGTVTVDTDPSTDVTGSGTSGQVSFWTGAQTQGGDAEFLWSSTNNRLIIGPTTTHVYPLEIFRSGSAESYGMNISMFNPGIRQEVKRTAGGAAFNVFECHGTNTTDNTTSLLGAIGINANIGSPPNGNYLFFGVGSTVTSGTNAFRINLNNNITANGSFRVGDHNVPAARLHVVGSGTSSTTWTAQFHNSAGNNNALMVRDDGNVGVGRSTMTGRRNIQCNGSFGIYATSTDPHYFAGSVGIGAIVDNTSAYNLRVTKTFSTVATARGIISDASIGTGPTTVTYFGASGNATATANVTNLFYYNANQSNFTAGSIFQTQIGYNVGQEMTGATNNYGFMGRIPAGANNFNLYMSGTAKNYLAGNTAIGTTTQNASAAFEVASTTQGVLFPRMTTAQRDLIATPADGLVIYNTTDNKLQVRAAGAWVDLH